MLNKIIVMTDIGSDIDDALSLLSVINHPEIEVAAVYAVGGDVVSRSYIAKHMVNLAGSYIPVLQGESAALGGAKAFSSIESFLVPDEFVDKKKANKNGSKNLVYQSLKKIGVEVNGFRYLAKMLKEGEYTIFSLGAMTGLANLVKKKRKLLSSIREVYVMGCRFNGPGEHNINQDVEAARIVFDSELPLVIVPGDLCSQHLLGVNGLPQLGQTKAGAYVRKMLDSFLVSKLCLELNSAMFKGVSLPLYLRDLEYGNFTQAAYQFSQLKNDFAGNIDYTWAIKESGEFISTYRRVIFGLRNPIYGYGKEGADLADKMSSLSTQQISIADVYVPYCYARREKIRKKSCVISIDQTGSCKKRPGNRHIVVTGLSAEDLDDFVYEHVR